MKKLRIAAIRRRSIKRQLRCAGVHVPIQITYGLRELRALRKGTKT